MSRLIDADLLNGRFIHGRFDDVYISEKEVQDAPTVDAVPREEHDRLVNTVKAMRESQKKYFKTRRMDALTESKQLENDVDALIRKEIGQGLTLFPSEK